MAGSPPASPAPAGPPQPGWWRRLRWVLLPAALALVAGLAVVAFFWHAWRTGPAADHALASTVEVRIHTGMTLAAAADTLAARGLLAHRTVFLAGARVRGADRSLQAGLYRLPRGVSPRELLRILTSGRAVPLRVTVPEGLEAVEVANLLGQQLGWDPDALLAAADARVRAVIDSLLTRERVARLDSLIKASVAGPGRRLYWCEGYLAPDTYHFAEGIGPEAVAAVLVQTQTARLDSCLHWARDGRGPWPAADWSAHDLLTLASIVEAEARQAAERPLIAAVFLNRLLEQGWRLEADPTVAFFLAKKGRRLFNKDLASESPYNTYRNHGLPPGPIGNPGRGSLAAVARPDTTCDALFFVADGQGGHVFSRTAAEHEAAVREFRRARSRGSR